MTSSKKAVKVTETTFDPEKVDINGSVLSQETLAEMTRALKKQLGSLHQDMNNQFFGWPIFAPDKVKAYIIEWRTHRGRPIGVDVTKRQYLRSEDGSWTKIKGERFSPNAVVDSDYIEAQYRCYVDAVAFR